MPVLDQLFLIRARISIFWLVFINCLDRNSSQIPNNAQITTINNNSTTNLTNCHACLLDYCQRNSQLILINKVTFIEKIQF